MVGREGVGGALVVQREEIRRQHADRESRDVVGREKKREGPRVGGREGGRWDGRKV